MDTERRGIPRLLSDIQRKEEEIIQLKSELEETNRGTVLLYHEIEKKTQELNIALLDLKELNEELESFSYAVAHDLRAPLRHINSFIELLDNNLPKDTTEKNHHYVQIIAASAHRMSELIDDLLYFSRISHVELHNAQCNLNNIAIEAIDAVKKEMGSRQIEWKIEPLPEVEGDPDMLRLVFRNLIGNAVKFTQTRDKALIEVGSEQNDDWMVIFVRDNGIGFENEYANKLFGIFQRLHPDGEFEGTGIGLATVRRILHKHQGETWAEGIVNRGATFYISFPIKKAGTLEGV